MHESDNITVIEAIFQSQNAFDFTLQPFKKSFAELANFEPTEKAV